MSAIEAAVDRGAQMEQLAQEIARVSDVVNKLERQRLDHAVMPNELVSLAARLSRLKTELAGLEARMAELVAAYDDEQAVERAAEEAERQRQREAAEKELPKLTKTRLDAFLAIEEATATLAAAVAAALEADQQVARVNYVLGVREAPAGNRIAAYIHTAIRDAGVKMDDFYLGGRHDLVVPSERPQPGRPCTVCAHPDLAAIHQAVDAREQSVAAIAGVFELGKDALHRHLANHRQS